MKPYAVMNVTAADKNLILQVHNSLRQKVANGLETRGKPGPQPPAANMRELVREIKFSLTCPRITLNYGILQTWDDELATMAQTWAQQCNFANDIDRSVGNV